MCWRECKRHADLPDFCGVPCSQRTLDPDRLLWPHHNVQNIWGVVIVCVLLKNPIFYTHRRWFLWLTGTLHRRNGFYTVQTIFYRPTTTLRLNLTGNFVHSYFLKKIKFCMIHKPFELWGHWKCPHKSPFPCNTHVIIQICVLINHINMHTHTHTHTHTVSD